MVVLNSFLIVKPFHVIFSIAIAIKLLNQIKKSYTSKLKKLHYILKWIQIHTRIYLVSGSQQTSEVFLDTWYSYEIPIFRLPEKVIEIICNPGDDSSCFNSFGECVQKHRFVSVLKKTGKCIKLLNSPNIWVDEWVLHDELVGSSCQCELNSLNFLKGWE